MLGLLVVFILVVMLQGMRGLVLMLMGMMLSRTLLGIMIMPGWLTLPLLLVVMPELGFDTQILKLATQLGRDNQDGLHCATRVGLVTWFGYLY